MGKLFGAFLDLKVRDILPYVILWVMVILKPWQASVYVFCEGGFWSVLKYWAGMA